MIFTCNDESVIVQKKTKLMNEVIKIMYKLAFNYTKKIK